MTTIFVAIIAPLAGFLLLIGLHQLALAVASFFARARHDPPASLRQRFAVVIPAHNEELLLGRLLASLREQDYPASRFEVYVVADNCDDATAAVGRRHGAAVHERFEPALGGKGHALRWLLDRLPLDEYDAAVFIDADSIVSRNLLRVMSAAFDKGHAAVQVYDGVLNATESAATRLRALSFALRNLVQPLGRSALRASAGLMGTGMAISTRLLRERSWDTFGLAEDVEMHLKMVLAGERVRFAPQASVLSDMSRRLSDSSGQNLRWDRGRLHLVGRYLPSLLAGAARNRSWLRLNAALELLVPPQSLQALGAAACLAGSALAGEPWLIAVAVDVAAVQVAYVVLGAVRIGGLTGAARALLFAPVYVGWKASLYARALVWRRDRFDGWPRAPRSAPDGR